MFAHSFVLTRQGMQCEKFYIGKANEEKRMKELHKGRERLLRLEKPNQTESEIRENNFPKQFDASSTFQITEISTVRFIGTKIPTTAATKKSSRLLAW